MMQKLKLDFQRRASNSVGGVVMLSVALLLGGLLFSDYRDLTTEAESSEAQLTRLGGLAGHKAANSGKPGDHPYSAEMKQANEVIDQLARPWDQLFGAVEEAAGKDVALLAVQPEKTKRMVMISGEARDVAAMLAYMRRLNKAQQLSNVDLLSHQIQQQDPQKPVHFNLSAKWIID